MKRPSKGWPNYRYSFVTHEQYRYPIPSLYFQYLDPSLGMGVPDYDILITPPKHDAARKLYEGDAISVYIMPQYHYQSLPPLCFSNL